LACASTSIWRGKSLVGHSVTTLALVALFAPLARFFWLSAWPTDAETDDPTCAARTIMSTAPFFVALFWVRARRVIEHPFAHGAALGTTAAAFGAVVVDVSCARAPPSHVVAGHVLPMIVSAIVGTFSGSFLTIREGPRDLARPRGVDRDESM
ncbi:MAG TPA: NrsF family protein, partial [Polyangiaceae bacterium]|nr:NrsF family protein [Polyangiaceae bacterium]